MNFFFGSECCCCYYLKLKINPDICDRISKDRKLDYIEYDKVLHVIGPFVRLLDLARHRGHQDGSALISE